MLLTIHDSKGRVLDGVLLAANSRQLRMILPGVADTIEVNRNGDQWVLSTGETVEIGAVVALTDVSAFCSAIELFSATAGSGNPNHFFD